MQATANHPPRTSGAYLAAAILITIGAIALVANLSGSRDVGDVVVLGLGVVFLFAYATTRNYGFLVPGGVLTGVGAGILAASLAGASDNQIYIGVAGGLGFLSIYGLDILVSRVTRRWWPVIPGAVMLVMAGSLATQEAGWIRYVGLWSPVVLIAIGIWILVARSRTVKT